MLYIKQNDSVSQVVCTHPQWPQWLLLWIGWISPSCPSIPTHPEPQWSHWVTEREDTRTEEGKKRQRVVS